MLMFVVVAGGMQSAGLAAENTTGSGATAAVNDYQFAGTATLTIRGHEKSAELVVTVLEPPVIDGDGVHHVVASHKFTFADGSSITTSDQEIAEPTATPGLYALTANMEVVSGTGIYEGVSGALTASGTMDFAAVPPAAQFDLAGTILEDTTGSGATTAINDYQFAGVTMFILEGREKSADLVVTVLEPPVVDGNGVQYVKATHQFTFADGSSLTTSDAEVATPTAVPGVYTIVAQMEIVSGAGLYEGVRGQLEANGTIDFTAIPPAAQFDLAGAVIENTRGTGATAAINDYQFSGTATLVIQGEEKSADLLVTVLEPPVVDTNGVQYVKAMHEFTFADGSSITTSDLEVATPTSTPGLYDITAQMDIASGTGIYEIVIGRLEANGKIDFAAQPPAAQFSVLGGISYCGDANHPYPVGDLNHDCRVDCADFAMVASHWLDCTGPTCD